VNGGECQQEIVAKAVALKLPLLELPDSRRLIHGHGWPDLTIIGPRELAFFEVKSEGEKLSREQAALKYRLEATGHYYRVLRPADLARGYVDAELGRLAVALR
jgi:hypothetical protein